MDLGYRQTTCDAFSILYILKQNTYSNPLKPLRFGFTRTEKKSKMSWQFIQSLFSFSPDQNDQNIDLFCRQQAMLASVDSSGRGVMLIGVRLWRQVAVTLNLGVSVQRVYRLFICE